MTVDSPMGDAIVTFPVFQFSILNDYSLTERRGVQAAAATLTSSESGARRPLTLEL